MIFGSSNYITLIALIITIVVLLILAAVSISILTGENGILKQANNAKEETLIGQEKEQVKLAYVSAVASKLGAGITDEDVQAELDKTVGQGLTLATDNGDGTLNVEFIDTKNNYNIDNGNVSSNIIMIGDSQSAIAKIVTKESITYYSSLNDAISAVPETGNATSVVLLSNVSENIIISSNKNVILNLNGKTITNIEGTASEGDWNQATVEVYGELEVKNGKIIEVYGDVIDNYSGTIKISGGTISSANFEY